MYCMDTKGLHRKIGTALIGSENKLVCSIDIAVIQIKMLVLYSIGQYALLVIQCG